MEIITRADNMSLVISPYRQVIEGVGQKEKVTDIAEEQDLNYFTLHKTDRVSTVGLIKEQNNEDKIFYFDFALKLLALYEDLDFFVYVESTEQGDMEDAYIFVLLLRGELIIDEIASFPDIVSDIRLNIGKLQERIEREGKGEEQKIKVQSSGLRAADENKIKFLFGETKIQYVSSREPLTESIILTNEIAYQHIRNLGKSLRPKRFGLGLFIIAGVIAALVGSVLVYQAQQPKEIKVVKRDDFKTYREAVTSIRNPQAYNRMKQEYNIHTLFNNNLVGWKVVRVEYSPSKAIVYTLQNTGGLLAHLHEQVRNLSLAIGFAAALDVTNKGVMVAVSGANIPVFEQSGPGVNDGIQIYNINEVYHLINDGFSTFIPNANVGVIDYDTVSDKWKTMNVQVSLQGVHFSDFLLIGNIFKALPVSVGGASYSISDGRVSGNFEFKIHGDQN